MSQEQDLTQGLLGSEIHYSVLRNSMVKLNFEGTEHFNVDIPV